MKSVCFSGRKFSRDCVPCMKPRPDQPPDPRAIWLWMMLYPAPKGSAVGSRKVSMRRN